MRKLPDQVKCSSLGALFSLITFLSWIGIHSRKLVKWKITLGVAILILKGALTADAQDMNAYRRAMCYYSISGLYPYGGRQFNIGISASYRNGLNQFDLKAGHYFRPVYGGLSLRYKTSNTENAGFYPGLYVRYSPHLLFYSHSSFPHIGLILEVNYHFSESAWKKPDDPLAQSVGVVTGLCTIFGVGSPFCCGVELSLEHEMMIYNSTVTDYYYPVLRFNYYFKVYGKRDGL